MGRGPPAPSTRADTVTVRGQDDKAVGSSDAAWQGVCHAASLKTRPALRPGEVLDFVPGLIVTQHAGDGEPRSARLSLRLAQ